MPELQAALEQAAISTPTEIQARAVPALLAGGDHLLASHTGSGKTLAYLLPLVQLLKRQESGEGFVGRPRRPRVLVLGPTKELAEQIGRVAKSLAHHAKFRATCLSGASSLKSQRDALSRPVDVVVATPTRLQQHLTSQDVYLGDVQWLVIDEADTMFDQGFGPEVTRVLTSLRSKAQPACVTLVSATMTPSVKRLLTQHLPKVCTLQTSSFHKAVPGSRHAFLSVPPGRSKLDVLLEVLQGDLRLQRKVLVFCGTMDSCRAVQHYCNENSMASVSYHGDMPKPARKEAMELFAGSSIEADPNAPSVMIATDLAARGLDFPGRIDHVVNFDFPTNPIDYIHRTGRTARAGAEGRITSIVAKRDKVLAQRIEWALPRGEALDQLSNNKEVLPPSQRPQAPPKESGARGQRPGGVGRGASQGPPGSRFGARPGASGGKPGSGRDARSGSRGGAAAGGGGTRAGGKAGGGGFAGRPGGGSKAGLAGGAEGRGRRSSFGAATGAPRGGGASGGAKAGRAGSGRAQAPRGAAAGRRGTR